MTTVSAFGPTVVACCRAARDLLGIKLNDSREVLRSGGDDGLYRVHLADGTVVECTVKLHARTEVAINLQ